MGCLAAVSYPDGVTQQTAQESAQKTDLLIKNMLFDTQKKTLSQLVMPTVFSDETLSQVLLSVYGSDGEMVTSLERLGIDASTGNVAKGLESYPEVYQRLIAASSWESVNLDGAKWEVQDKYGFANALAAMLMPFNDVLYMMLCGSTYRANLITLHGDYGYQNGIVPMLKALGCTEITQNEKFLADASQNRNTMIYNIVLSVFSAVEKILEQPAVRLSQIMPNLAHYIKNGGLESSVNSLMSPLTLGIEKYVSFFSGAKMLSVLMFIQDSQKFTTNFSDNITIILNDAISSTDFELAEIDLDKLASCGTLSGDTVEANIGEAYTVIFTWLIDTLKLNKDKVMTMLSEGETDLGEIKGIAEKLFAKSTDEIFAFIVGLFTAKEGRDIEYQWQTPGFTATQVTYTQNLGQEKFQRVLDGIDDLISQFIAESSDDKNVSELLERTIYSSNVVSQLAVGLYGALSGKEMGEMTAMLGFALSPSAVANEMPEKQFSYARRTLYRNAKWENIKPERLYWGFRDGDKKGFENALTAVLRPFEDLLRMLLVSDTLEIYGSINIGGSNGYNTAVIPLLEALGCPSDSIMSYDEFKKAADGDGVVKNLLKPVLALADKITQKPVFTVTEIVPNIVFFASNGSLMQCISNLASPLFGLLDEFSIKAEDLGINLDEIKNTDILAKASEMVTQIEDIKLEKPDLKKLGTIGQAQTYQSKATYNGAPVSLTYVKADQTGVLITALRFIANIISNPENSSLMDSFMGGSEGGGTFGEFSSGIGDQMSQMSTDELIEWLYKLFFRERAVKEEKEIDINYSTAFKYVEQKESNSKQIASAVIIILVLAAAVFIIFRKRIIDYFTLLRQKKATQIIAEEKEM